MIEVTLTLVVYSPTDPVSIHARLQEMLRQAYQGFPGGLTFRATRIVFGEWKRDE